MDIYAGAQIIVDDWLHADREDVFLIVTDENHPAEAEAISRAAASRGAITKVSVLATDSIQDGDTIEELREVMSYSNVIIGATDYSFITTNAVSYALKRGARFLSLPLSTNNGRSLLESGFLAMDPQKAARTARPLLRRLERCDTIRAVTAAGTDITFSKKNRKAGFFNGATYGRQHINSSSFEVYVPVVESSAEGTVVVDGSLGYIGAPSAPFSIEFKAGRISHIEDTSDGRRLREYIESFNDDRMYHASEFGIGLNELSRCRGDSYIEDESSFGTFHIGFGRNLALGGEFDAEGHFDLVMREPDIFAGRIQITDKGVPRKSRWF